MSDASLKLRLTNRRTEIAPLTEAVDRFGQEQHLAGEDLHNIHLVLDELVVNVIKYAHTDADEHAIDVHIQLNGNRMVMRIEDDGREFDPTAVPTPNFDLPIEERPIGGLGIHIVRSLSDSVTYQRAGGRNILTVVKTVQR